MGTDSINFAHKQVTQNKSEDKANDNQINLSDFVQELETRKPSPTIKHIHQRKLGHWMRKSKMDNGIYYYEYLLLYVNDCLVASQNPGVQ